MGATETALAKLTAEHPAEAIPSDVLHHAVRCVINFLGVAIYASKDPSFGIMTGLIKEEGAREAATVVGTGLRTSPQNAALANGYLGHFEDYDDSHDGSGIHPTSPSCRRPSQWGRTWARPAWTCWLLSCWGSRWPAGLARWSRAMGGR